MSHLSNEEVFYCYVLLDPLKPGNYNYGPNAKFSYEPFYVGKGHGNRSEVHVRVAKRNKQHSHKEARIRKILRAGHEVIVKRTRTLSTEAMAFKRERELVALIGRRIDGAGPLTNLTEGGEGVVGLIHTKASRQKMKASAKAFWESVDEKGRRAHGQKTREFWEHIDESYRKKFVEKSHAWMKDPKKYKARNKKVSKAAQSMWNARSAEDRAEHAKKSSAWNADKDKVKKVGARRSATILAKREEWSKKSTDAHARMSEETKALRAARQAEKWKLRKQVRCPHCPKKGYVAGMTRWHFDNCKFK